MRNSTSKMSRLERLMFRPVPLWTLLLMLLLGLLGAIGLSALTLYGTQNGPHLKWLQNAAIAVASLPQQVRTVAASAKDPFEVGQNGGKLAAGFSRDPGFNDSGYLLLTRHDRDGKQPQVQLIRLSDGHVVHEYRINGDALNKMAPRSGLPFDIWHPELMPDGGLLANAGTLLVRTDACGRLIWASSGPHHSIERGLGDQIWVPANVPSFNYGDPPVEVNSIARIDSNGRTNFVRPLTRIFDDNGLTALYLGRPFTKDPFHLNDVQPVMRDGPYWKAGDVFMSLRHQSMIMLYRPSSGKILWWRIGPWSGQHDVSIIDDHRIGVFDNNMVLDSSSSGYVRDHARELVYDFATDTVSSPWEQAFAKHRIVTTVGGRGLPFPNGDLFVEESNGGRLYRMTSDGTVRWRYVHADASGRRYRFSWARYLDPATVAKGVDAASKAHCTY